MADQYVITGANTTTVSPGDTALALEGQADIRARIYEIIMGHGGSPGDTLINWLVRRGTALGTSTAVTPAKLDNDAPASQLAGAEDHTAEPTYTAATELIDIDLNQRATFRWVASPNGEILLPASATAVVGVTPIAASYTGESAATMHFWE